MDIMEIVVSINKVLWGPFMLFLLLGTGIYFSLKMRFIQVRKVKLAFKQTFGFLFEKEKKVKVKGEVSSFQSLATAIAAQVGTGNLAGVAGAIVSGGPGAVFWMWISGFFGMGTIFAEAVIAQRFVQVKDGEKVGGPAYYIRYGLNNKFLAAFFAIAIILALGLMGNVVQANSIAASVYTAFKIPKIVTGVFVAVLVMLIVVGGVSRINSVTEKVVPFMALFYIIGSSIIIILNADMIIPAFKMIFVGAFNPKALGGGIIGVSIKEAFRYGVARGLFSNEAGMGSTPHSHALAKVNHPAEQGLTATLGVIIDTGIICTMTALVILTTGALDSGFTGAELTQAAFTYGFGSFGTKFVAICLFFFAFSTIIGWYFFGEANVKYLFGKIGILPYRVLVSTVIVFGTVIKVPLVWELADMFNALMVFPNLIALLAMGSLVFKIANDFECNFLKNKDSEYENEKIS
ncbi:alanine/glycine:cation symporter family protein [Proteocatella sphenisci]|uniref:alanine/glycine:cation symporter family protein n=1 Tax=Proteocatella sphenisci TaxID=181070 RepID=UPI00048CF186|nr:sodium:alanine symporter family protein [Proteocatella sphenisci]